LTEIPGPYRGRFAPSPTGDLHLGSLVAAVASFLEARRHGGAWLIRIDDIDPPREVQGSANRILNELERLGMLPDEEVLYQSTRTDAHREAVDALVSRGEAFWCGCSRSEIPPSGIYPGTCRGGLPAGRRPRSVRLLTEKGNVSLDDRVQGRIEDALDATVGDFVIWRADGLPAYQLAVVIDDAFQRVSHIVRGADLLDSTPRQIYLQKKLALPTPGYAHIPVLLDSSGDKLAKRLGSDPISNQDPANALKKSLQFLGQNPPENLSLAELWAWALEEWDLAKVPRRRSINGGAINL
jgi:glutamyl-Q tRNA(Asp) synthetase